MSARGRAVKIAKGAGIAVGVVALAIAGFAGYVAVDGVPRYEAKPPDLHITITPERIARGEKLASLMCTECHQDAKTKALTGHYLADLPKQFGPVYSKNITGHKEKGIGSWTDGELAYFLRTGVRRDGQYVPPWMIKVPHLADEDLASIIAFLRSNDPRVAPADVDVQGTTTPSFLTKMLTHTVMKPLPYPTQPITIPPRTDRVAFGKYLATSLDCWTCHSADFKTMNVMEPHKTPGFYGGGNPIGGMDGTTILTANLTPDEATGIGRWSEADFVRALRKGFRPDGRVLRAPMMPKPELDDDEAGAIYAYLRTVPKLQHEVARNFPALDSGAPPGPRAFAKYGCTGCHGANGSGNGSNADLRQANDHYKTDPELRAWIEDAPSKKPGTRMPAWKGIIAEEDYAPLMAHVRTLANAASAEHASN